MAQTAGVSYRRLRAGAVGALLLGSLVASSTGGAHAAANPGASCLGVGSSSFGGTPGARAAAERQVQEDAQERGTVPGQDIKLFAAQHSCGT